VPEAATIEDTQGNVFGVSAQEHASAGHYKVVFIE